MYKWIRRFLLFWPVTFFTLIVIAVGARLCLTVLFAPSAPVISPQLPVAKTVKETDITELNLPLSIPLAALKKAAEQYVPETYTDIDEDPTDMLIDDTLTYHLKRGEITMEIKGNGFSFSFPVSGTVNTDGKVNLGVVKFKTSAHADVEGIISGSIAFKILPDWRLEPDLDFKVDISKAAIPIKRLGTISLRTFLEEKLSKKISRKKKRLTKKVMDKDIIRDKVTDVWKKMHRVKMINKKPLAWAKVIPQEVGFMPLLADGKDMLKIGIRLTLKTIISVSDNKPSITYRALPDAKILKGVTDSFSLRVPVKADMATLNRFIEKKTVGREEEPLKDLTVSVKRAELLSSGNNQLTAVLFVEASHKQFGLKTEGRFYVHGHVVYHNKTGKVRFINSGYDVAFSRWWASAAHWIAAPWISYELDQRLIYPLNNEIEKAHESMNKWIESLVVPPGVKADLVLKTPELLQLIINRDGIFAELKLDGNLSAELSFPEIKPLKNKRKH